MDNPTKFHLSILELINEFNNIARYKMNIQKSTISVQTCNEHFRNIIKKIIPFMLTSKRIKCLGIDLTRKVLN